VAGRFAECNEESSMNEPRFDQDAQSGSVPARGDHWETVYTTASSTELSWYERQPATSLRLIEEIASEPSAAVIDIGAGTSSLIDRLLAKGFTDVTVLDIAQHALTEVQQRLGHRAKAVTFVHQDVLTWKPDRQYDIWHDRAVFHFLTDTSARDRYVDLAARSIRHGGVLVLATFAEDGPAYCSGLPVARYTARDLADAFAASCSLVRSEREEHVTPAGVVQPFTWAVLRRM
jgi:2-polyprenyl-3-methyl-5-hydroxy-6-metoxy-1,4-benzoquinol methylase